MFPNLIMIRKLLDERKKYDAKPSDSVAIKVYACSQLALEETDNLLYILEGMPVDKAYNTLLGAKRSDVILRSARAFFAQYGEPFTWQPITIHRLLGLYIQNREEVFWEKANLGRVRAAYYNYREEPYSVLILVRAFVLAYGPEEGTLNIKFSRPNIVYSNYYLVKRKTDEFLAGLTDTCGDILVLEPAEAYTPYLNSRSDLEVSGHYSSNCLPTIDSLGMFQYIGSNIVFWIGDERYILWHYSDYKKAKATSDLVNRLPYYQKSQVVAIAGGIKDDCVHSRKSYYILAKFPEFVPKSAGDDENNILVLRFIYGLGGGRDYIGVINVINASIDNNVDSNEAISYNYGIQEPNWDLVKSLKVDEEWLRSLSIPQKYRVRYLMVLTQLC